jgi:cold shock CspA family protein
MAQGTLWWINEATGYGLIHPRDGSRDLLVRCADVAAGEAEPIEEGAEVSYEAKRGRTGRTRALNVCIRRRYSWLDDCLERLEGKEARHEYYARLD